MHLKEGGRGGRGREREKDILYSYPNYSLMGIIGLVHAQMGMERPALKGFLTCQQAGGNKKECKDHRCDNQGSC